VALDTSSFPAYVRSLRLRRPVTTKPGRLIPGPPAPVLDIALQLGLASLLFDTPRTRDLLNSVGVDPSLIQSAGPKLRSRAMWSSVLEDAAAPFIRAADEHDAHGERELALRNIEVALTLLFVQISGDGYYFYTPMGQRRQVMATTRRLYRKRRLLRGARIERIAIRHGRGRTFGLLHLPPRTGQPPNHRFPALVALHPLGSDKDTYDSFLGHFRDAGYATLCLDLPAHGENYDGPRLRPDAELAGVAALEILAQHPSIDPGRLGVMGGSLGALFAQRTAAASPRVRACLAYASPFDVTYRMEDTLPGVLDCFQWVVGASGQTELVALASGFHLRDVLDKIGCPVCLLHGTQDHICYFIASYEIASRLRVPVTVQPVEGADHEVSNPATAVLARPGIEWLRTVL
jgi:alpha-beta hydrolase superfamily lysophospholipase